MVSDRSTPERGPSRSPSLHHSLRLSTHPLISDPNSQPSSVGLKTIMGRRERNRQMEPSGPQVQTAPCFPAGMFSNAPRQTAPRKTDMSWPMVIGMGSEGAGAPHTLVALAWLGSSRCCRFEPTPHILSPVDGSRTYGTTSAS